MQQGRLGNEERVVLEVPHYEQKSNWDCGLACFCMVLRYLGKCCDSVYYEDLRMLQCGDRHTIHYFCLITEYRRRSLHVGFLFGTWYCELDRLVALCLRESVWTIDLAKLMKLHGISHRFCTMTLGVDKGYAKKTFYRSHFNSDELRVNELFEMAPREGIVIEKRSTSLADIINHLKTNNILVHLIDWSLLDCLRCHAKLCDCLHNLGKCFRTFQGHYIVVCGFDMNRDIIYYRNPSISRNEVCLTHTSTFEQARKSHGTDEDVIFVYSNSS